MRTPSLPIALLLWFCNISTFATWGEGLDIWHWRNPLPQGNGLISVAYGNGNWIAVGGTGTILTSRDGAQWVTHPSGVTEPLISVVYGNDRFVVLNTGPSGYGPGSVLFSTNQSDWVKQPLPIEGRPAAIAYGNGLFAVVGTAFPRENIATSPDGLKWTPRDSGVSSMLLGIAFGNGRFVSVAGPEISVSEDGVTWTPAHSPSSDPLFAVTYGNGLFVAVGGGPEPFQKLVWTSKDGLTWFPHKTATTEVLSGVAFGSGKFVAVGKSGTIILSADATNWVQRTSPVTLDLSAITTDGEHFVAVGGLGTILFSSDAETWANETSSVAGFFSSIVYGAGRFTAFGQDFFGTQPITATSPDGTNWVTTRSTHTFAGVAVGNGQFVSVGAAGKILSSADGMNWTPHSSGVDKTLLGVIFAAGQFVAFGDLGTIVTSPDGIAWTSRDAGTKEILRKAAYGNGRFVIIGSGIILSSSDAENWTTNIQTGLSAIAYGEGRFVAISLSGTAKVLISSDGLNWSRHNANGPVSLFSGLTHGRAGFIGFGRFPAIFTSNDGLSWTQRPTPVSLQAVTYGPDTIVAVGAYSIIQSGKIGERKLIQPLVRSATKEVQFSLSEGRGNYRLEAATNLSSPWTDLGLITDSNVKVPLKPETLRSRFFRAVPTP